VGPGVTIEQARAELSQYANQAGAGASPNTHVFSTQFHPLITFAMHEEVVGSVRPAMMMLLGAVCFVLLISCVNVANLLLARAEGRQREIAIRGALGASLRRLIVQFVTEGVLLSSLGTIIGLLLAYNGLALVKAASDASI